MRLISINLSKRRLFGEKSGKNKKEHFPACRSKGTENAKHFYVFKNRRGVIND